MSRVRSSRNTSSRTGLLALRPGPLRPGPLRRGRLHTAVTAVAALALGVAGAASAQAAPHRASAAATSAAGPAAAAVTAGTIPAAVPTATGTPHTVTYDDYSFLVDGKRTYLWGGEFHYYRLPSPGLWRDILQKMRAAGFTSTSIYFSWGYHSAKPGVYDFTGVRDVDQLLDIAQEVGIDVIARPGPYINAEVDGGGFPAWLGTEPGRARSTDPTYLKAADEWLTKIDAIIARHQLTNGTGSVIGYQVENEFYDGSPAGRDHMVHLENKAKADGITVPLLGNNNGTFSAGTGALAVDGADNYPQGFNCSTPAAWSGVQDLSYTKIVGKPLISPEFQGGAFDPWGGPGYAKCAQLINDRFADVFYTNNIANGLTAQSFYMTYGGTSWGWQPIPQNYTSYDYGAAITEARQFDPKYEADKRLGYFVHAVTPLTKTTRLNVSRPDNGAIVDTARVNPDDGTQFHTLRHADSTATTVDSAHISLSLRDGTYPTVPQEPGTAITLDGRDSAVLVAGYRVGGHELRYSTSRLMTVDSLGAQDVALLWGRPTTAGETVLRYASRPTVEVLGGSATSTWDAARGDLRLDYTHTGLTRVRITGGGQRPLLLLLATDTVAGTFWHQDTASGPVLVRGGSLLRTAATSGGQVTLTGDSSATGPLEVFSRAGTSVTWNSSPFATTRTTSGSLLGATPAPKPVTLPALTTWKHAAGSPESQPAYDDSSWVVADHATTNSTTTPGTLPVLFSDDYGFHTGDTWYRGRFRGTGKETGISLSAQTGGNAGAWSVWLNGRFLGSSSSTSQRFAFPAGSVLTGGDNVLSVVVEDMGHEQDYNSDDTHKQARGLTGANLVGAPLESLTWRLQGARGGEDIVDPVRGPLNTGGLSGERLGWTLPGYPDGAWQTRTVPDRDTTPGISWYRTTVDLHTPAGQDSSLGLRFDDTPDHAYRAVVYVNGWLMGRYVNQVGPQHSFPIPTGILRTHGRNTIAIAVWNTDATTGGLGKVSLESSGSPVSSLQVADVASPAYSAATYAVPASPRAALSLTVPDAVTAGRAYPVSVTGTVPAGAPAATGVTVALTAPAGWTVKATTPTTAARVAPGGSVTARWTVTTPTGTLAPFATLRAEATYTQAGTAGAVTDARTVRSVPPVPPAGKDQVSSLPFLSATNSWGPVERDTSNGEAAAGDGHPITIGGTVHARGLGVNPDSTIAVYTAGRCSTFSAVVGVDDEVGSQGTVVFSLVADGRTVATTPLLTGNDPAGVPLTGSVAGAQVVELVVGPGPDGNGSDHADWADPVLTCR